MARELEHMEYKLKMRKCEAENLGKGEEKEEDLTCALQQPKGWL